MTARPVLIVLSLAANVALGIVWLRGSAVRHDERPTPASIRVAVPTTRPTALTLSPEAWRAIDAKDDPSYITRLREQGFPPEIIRALVALRVRARYADRLAELRNKQVVPYWRRSMWGDGRDPATRAAQRELNREMDAEIKGLLGPDAEVATEAQRAMWKRDYGNLAPEKIRQIQAINADYGELMSQLREQARGIVLPEDRPALAYLEQQRRADLAKVLSPDELAEFDMRVSPSAREVQSRLALFQPTEEEYRKVVQLQLAFDTEYGGQYPTPEQQFEKRAAQAAHDANIKAALGPVRGPQFEVMTDGSYRSVTEIASSLNLPDGTAYDVVKLKRDVVRQIDAITNDPSLSAEARLAQLTQLEKQASDQLVLKLGAKGLDLYRARTGEWLNNLKARTGSQSGTH
jgi:hypothetical protein